MAHYKTTIEIINGGMDMADAAEEACGIIDPEKVTPGMKISHKSTEKTEERD